MELPAQVPEDITMKNIRTIKVILTTNKPEDTEGEWEDRCDEFYVFRLKLAAFLEQVSGFVPEGWIAEVEC